MSSAISAFVHRGVRELKPHFGVKARSGAKNGLCGIRTQADSGKVQKFGALTTELHGSRSECGILSASSRAGTTEDV